jgi:hypothetical protein
VCDKVLDRTAANAASDDLEARATRQCRQSRRRPKFADGKTPGIKFSGDFRTAKDNAQIEIDTLVVKKALLSTQSELEAASICWNAIFDRSAHAFPAQSILDIIVYAYGFGSAPTSPDSMTKRNRGIRS